MDKVEFAFRAFPEGSEADTSAVLMRGPATGPSSMLSDSSAPAVWPGRSLVTFSSNGPDSSVARERFRTVKLLLFLIRYEIFSISPGFAESEEGIISRDNFSAGAAGVPGKTGDVASTAKAEMPEKINIKKDNKDKLIK